MTQLMRCRCKCHSHCATATTAYKKYSRKTWVSHYNYLSPKSESTHVQTVHTCANCSGCRTVESNTLLPPCQLFSVLLLRTDCRTIQNRKTVRPCSYPQIMGLRKMSGQARQDGSPSRGQRHPMQRGKSQLPFSGVGAAFIKKSTFCSDLLSTTKKHSY